MSSKRRYIHPAKTKTLGRAQLSTSEEGRVLYLLQQFKSRYLGDGNDAGSMARSIMSFFPGQRGSRCREVIEISTDSVSHNRGFRLTIIQGSDDEFFERVNQSSYAGPENIVSFVIEFVSGEADVSKAVIEMIKAVMNTLAADVLQSQPFRLYVRCLLVIDGAQICQVHFDRCGAAYTRPFNVNTDPETFIRLVLNSTSSDICAIGVDPNPRFKTEAGLKVGASIVLKNEFGERVRYEMDPKPLYIEESHRLVGRATTCHKLRLAGREYVLKISWREPELRAKEASNLEKAKSIKAVARIISYDSSARTDALRGLPVAERSPSDRTNEPPRAHRVLILMERTGPPIYTSTCEKQLIEALRDILVGIQDLFFVAEILHGDISMNNLMFGPSGAAKGEKGKIVDLDMARNANDQSISYHGTLASMSLSTLQRALTSERQVELGRFHRLLPHDILDDLESFGWVFLDIVTAKDGPSGELGTRLPVLSEKTYLAAYNAKRDLFLDYEEYDLRTLSPHWSPTMLLLFQRVYKFIRRVALHKQWLVQGQDVEEKEYAAMKNRLPEYVDEMQGFFDDALAEYAAVDTTPPSPGSPTSAAVPERCPSTDTTQPSNSPEPSEVETLQPSPGSPTTGPTPNRSPSTDVCPAPQHGLRSPLQPRLDENYNAEVVPAVAKASPPRRAKRKASEVELENRPVPAKQRK